MSPEDLPSGGHRVCPRCGATPSDSAFCMRCGLNLHEQDELPTADAFSAEVRSVAAEGTEPRLTVPRVLPRSRRAAFLSTVAALLVVAGVAAMTFAGSDDQQQSVTDSSPAQSTPLAESSSAPEPDDAPVSSDASASGSAAEEGVASDENCDMVDITEGEISCARATAVADEVLAAGQGSINQTTAVEEFDCYVFPYAVDCSGGGVSFETSYGTVGGQRDESEELSDLERCSAGELVARRC